MSAAGYTPKPQDFEFSEKFVWARWRMENAFDPKGKPELFPMTLTYDGFTHTYDLIQGRLVRADRWLIVE